MKKYILLFSISFIGVFYSFPLFSQSPDLYAFIVTQEDSELGAQVDKITMSNLMESIKQNIPGMSVHVKYLDDSQTSRAKIQRELNNIDVDNNDVVWFYYSGHGYTFDSWPITAEEEIPLTWVHEQLKATNARLTLAMYDCYNFLTPLEEPPSNLMPKSTYYKFLFLEAKGNIIAASCSSTQYSYGNEQSGGIFTNSFIDAIKTHGNWDDVFEQTKKMSMENARERSKTQVPVYDIQDLGTSTPIPAPSLKPKWFNSLDEMAKELTKSINQNGIYGTVTVADIKQWNPGVNKRNFKTFKRLKFKPHDPFIGRNDYNNFPKLGSNFPKPSCIGKIPIEKLIPYGTRKNSELKLSLIQKRLESVLDTNGYYELRYFGLQNLKGFAVATRIERFNPQDAFSIEPRFSRERNKLSLYNFSIPEYINQLFIADAGHYRIMLFVVSPSLEINHDKQTNAQNLKEQIYTKGNPIPANFIMNEKISVQELFCNVLIYEFKNDRNENELKRIWDSNFQGHQHLTATGILQAVQNLNNKPSSSK